VNVTEVHGALYASENASVHPGRLVRDLARAIEQHGAVIYERSVAGGAAPRLPTPGGKLRAKKALVLAGEAYLTRFSKLHRALLPVYSSIALTERLTETVVPARLAEPRESRVE
jgi:glycine/D-amino acid oxidase-like deaminating enzyme